MPKQNRVTPFGRLVAVDARGTLMGNRGVLHDDRQRIVRHHQGRRWIACVTEFRGRHRTVMTPRSYTELFFLDEATALAAGHRPCAECRRADFDRFVAAWVAGGAGVGPGRPQVDEVDRRLDRERLVGRDGKVTFDAPAGDLPPGVMVALEGDAWLMVDGGLGRWTPSGYAEGRPAPPGPVAVLTPRSIVGAIDAGYEPEVHPSGASPPA